MHNILNELRAAALLTAMENQKDGIEEVFSGKRKSLKLDLSDTKDMTFAGNFPTANASVATVRPGVVSKLHSQLHIRDLVPQGLMTGSNYIYINEGTINSLPQPTNEGAEKEALNYTYTQEIANAEWIAGYLVCSRNMMDDIVAFASYLEARLPQLLLIAEDDKFITDIINNSVVSSAGPISVNQIISDLGQLAAFYRVPNGILVSYKTYFDILVNSTNAAISTSNGQMYIAGIPVFPNTQLPIGKSIVGDWTNGANLIVRDPIRVEFFNEDADNIRKNNITVRIEERVAFPIFGNNYFVYKA